MYQPSSSEIGSQDAPHERETVIKFVISGPFLNAEAAHTKWAAEPPSSSALQELVRRIADLERKLDEERALVEMLSRQAPASPAPEPAPAHAPAPLSKPTAEAEAATEPAAAPSRRYSFETVAQPVAEPTFLSAVQTMAESAASTIAAPPPPPAPLSTVAQTPPPKVRGLRRMIGALRRL